MTIIRSHVDKKTRLGELLAAKRIIILLAEVVYLPGLREMYHLQ